MNVTKENAAERVRLARLIKDQHNKEFELLAAMTLEERVTKQKEEVQKTLLAIISEIDLIEGTNQ